MVMKEQDITHMTRIKRILIIAITLLCCVGCDQATKAVAKEYLPRNQVMSFAHDILRLEYAENRGAFLSIGATLTEKSRAVIFTLGVGALVIGIMGYLLFAPALSRSSTIALALIAGGGLSNLGDRIAYGGYVVDFLNVGVGSLRTGIFNVADMAIMAGVIYIVATAQKRDGGVDA